MAQLQPNVSYPLVYQINPLDTNAYYIQAVIVLSNKNTVWQTVKLTNSGNNRYIGKYTTPTDGSMGTPIDITYYVYTDSGYSQLSNMYDTKNVEHIVATLFSPSIGFSAGSDGMNADDIDKIVRAALAGQPMPKGLEIGDIDEKFANRLKPMINLLHEKTGNISNKQDEVVKTLGRMKSSHGRISNKLGSIREENKKMIYDSSKETRDSLSKMFLKELSERIKKLEDRFLGEISGTHKKHSEEISNLQREFNVKFTEASKEKTKFKRKNVDHLINSFREGLKNLDNDSLEFPEEDKNKEKKDRFIKALVG
jgi:hypothetical protein